MSFTAIPQHRHKLIRATKCQFVSQWNRLRACDLLCCASWENVISLWSKTNSSPFSSSTRIYIFYAMRQFGHLIFIFAISLFRLFDTDVNTPNSMNSFSISSHRTEIWIERIVVGLFYSFCFQSEFFKRTETTPDNFIHAVSMWTFYKCFGCVPFVSPFHSHMQIRCHSNAESIYRTSHSAERSPRHRSGRIYTRN